MRSILHTSLFRRFSNHNSTAAFARSCQIAVCTGAAILCSVSFAWSQSIPDTSFHSAFVNAQSNFTVPPSPALAPGASTSQTAVAGLDTAVNKMKETMSSLEAAWPNASDEQRGNMAGALNVAEKLIMAQASAIASQLGCVVPNKPAGVPNYYAESDDLKKIETQADDISDAVVAARGCIAPDQQQSTTSKVLHSRAFGIATGTHTEFWGKGKRDQAKLQDQMLTQYAQHIAATVGSIAQYIPSASALSEAHAAAHAATFPAAAATGAAGDFPAGPGLPVLHTSRTPDEGCRWAPFVSTEAHIALLVEKCADARRTEDVSKLVSTYKAGSQTEIIVFTKPAEENLDTAVRLQAGSHLKQAARLACHIVPNKQQTGDSSWQWYDFHATSGPLVREYKSDEIKDEPCDPWEQDDTAVAFLYQPAASKTHFLWVQLGQETPSWDVESIRFLP